MKEIKIILCGCGGVGRQFLQLLAERRADIKNQYHLDLAVIAAVDCNGAAVADSEQGLPLRDLLEHVSRGKEVQEFPGCGEPGLSGVEAIKQLDAQVMVEATPTNLVDGGIGTHHIFTAIEQGMEVVSANKGPFVLYYSRIFNEARKQNIGLHISAATAAALPTLDVGLTCLAGSEVLSMEGILNGTTNYILTEMRDNKTPYDIALKNAQAAGIAETNPSYDVEGKDTANKTILIANRVFGATFGPKDIHVTGITDITPADIDRATEKGTIIKLIGAVERIEDTLSLSVAPRELALEHPLAHVSGSEKAITYVTDTMGSITVMGGKSSPVGAAAALLKDLINAFK